MMPFTPDPRAFYPTVYSMTRLLLMPSLWNESFGLVAAEAMLNGIPVLASNRRALTETVGGSPHPNPNTVQIAVSAIRRRSYDVDGAVRSVYAPLRRSRY